MNTSSAAGIGGGAAGVAYTVSKHALVGLTRSTAFRYALDGIRCNAMACGGVETNIMQSIDTTKIDGAGAARYGAYQALIPAYAEAEGIRRTWRHCSPPRTGQAITWRRHPDDARYDRR